MAGKAMWRAGSVTWLVVVCVAGSALKQGRVRVAVSLCIPWEAILGS